MDPNGATRRCSDGSAGSLAALRRTRLSRSEPATSCSLLLVLQHVGGRLRGVDGVLTVVEQLAGCAVPASALEPFVLSSRVMDYTPATVDELPTARARFCGWSERPARHRRVGLRAPGPAAHLTLPDVDPEMVESKSAAPHRGCCGAADSTRPSQGRGPAASGCALSAGCRATHPSVPGRAPLPAQNLARGGELVEHGRRVVDAPAAEHEGLEGRGGHRAAGQLLDHRQHAVDAAQPAADVVATRQEPGECAGSTGSTSWRRRRQRTPAEPRAPRRRTTRCPMPAGRNSPSRPARQREPAQRVGAPRPPSPKRAATSAGERAVGAGVPADQVAEGVGDRSVKASGRRAARGRPARRAAARRPRPRPSARCRRPGPRTARGRCAGRRATCDVGAGTARRPRQCVSGPSTAAGRRRPRRRGPVGRRRAAAGRARPRSARVGVEQLAQLGPAEQLGQQRGSSARAAARRSASGESPS